jgi:hypothetical protein
MIHHTSRFISQQRFANPCSLYNSLCSTAVRVVDTRYSVRLKLVPDLFSYTKLELRNTRPAILKYLYDVFTGMHWRKLITSS